MNQIQAPSIASRKGQSITMRTLTAASVAVAALMLPEPSNAAQLTFEMRVNPVGTSAGVVISPDLKSATASAPGDVIALQLFAVVNSQNALHSDDGFLNTNGAFVSGFGGLLGNLRGAPAGSSTSPGVNNVAPFNTPPAAVSGFQLDLDGDGDEDVGNIQDIAAPNPTPWFVAANVSTQLGSGAGTGVTEFLLGQTTFTLSTFAGTTTINYVPRLRTGGLVNTQTVHKFRLDGVDFTYRANNPELAVGQSILIAVPEPSTVGMLLLGTVGLMGLRRRR